MEYELIYDAAHSFAGWEIIAIGLSISILLLIFVFFKKNIHPFFHWLMFNSEGANSWVKFYITGVITLFGIISAIIIYSNVKIGSISKKNDCKQIAGVVTNFRASADNKHKESFELNGMKFHYFPRSMKPGFDRIAAEGGPIYEGAKIRICYINRIKHRKKHKIIIRVEADSTTAE